MKYALISGIEFSTQSHKNTLAKGLKDKLAGKRLWVDERNPNTVADNLSENGKPRLGIVQRFEDKDERDETALFLEDLILRIPALEGTVRPHRCFHDEGGRPCEPEVIS